MEKMNFDIKNIDNVDYIVQQTKTETGVLTVQYIPTGFAIKEIESNVNGINGDMEGIRKQRVLLDAKEIELNDRLEQLQGMKEKIEQNNITKSKFDISTAAKI